MEKDKAKEYADFLHDWFNQGKAVGAHDAIEALIKMIEEINSRPIYSATRYMMRVSIRGNENFVSLENLCDFLKHHRDHDINKTGYQDSEKLPRPKIR